ncbi:MAG: hypothetical protein J0G32_05170 [Alphaproteobacteria bacterium]|nr:hypothetical protein [Alphaproteobacteria bacterium]OJV15319.1 MAG: hypothetical protein BGO27_02290 [Alphaproteobacteria bacterium 33-17]
MKIIYLTILSIILSSCAFKNTSPVAVIGQDGRVLVGSSTASLYSSHFQVSDGKLTCSGNYDGLNTSLTLTLNVICSDGRKGFANVHRDPNGLSGHGNVVLKDGYRADFVFGEAAKAFQ